jgi:UDP-sulfoquinovose synthase
VIPAIPSDDAGWDRLRATLFPGDRINLNPGTLGTASTHVRDAMRAFQAEEDGAFPLGQYQRGRDALRRARARAAEIWGDAPAICAGTTQTMNLLTLALPGILAARPIVVLTSAHEHHGGVGGFEHHPAWRVAYLTPRELVDDAAFAARVAQEAPAVALLSQRTWTDGRALPVERLCARLGEQAPGCLRIVDAAQVVGVLPPALGSAEIVVASAHKWLGGPPGTGFVWVSPAARERLGRLHWVGEGLDPTGPCPGLEIAGGQDFSVYAGVEAALALYAAMGPDRVRARSRALAAHLCEALAAALPATVVDAEEAVVRVRFPTGDPYPLYTALNQRGVHVKCVKERLPDGEELRLLRLGVPWYESRARLDHVASLARQLGG